MATHTNSNRFVKTMPKWVTEANDRVGPKPPPPPSPSTPDSGIRAPILPPKFKNQPEPDYEVIEFSGQQYSNEVLKSGSRSKTPSTPDSKLKCTLCGSHNPWVTCEECAQQIFCASCDDMFHKHPKRRAHIRKAIEPSRPPLPPKILPGQNGPTPPVAPPRRKGRGFCTPLLQRKEQVNNANLLPIPPSPTPSMKSSSWQERVQSLKSGLNLNLTNRPLPDTPKTPTSEHTSSRSVTPKSVFDSIQRPPSVTLEKIKSKASATLDKMALLQQRYRQHKEESQKRNTDRSGSVTDQNLSFDQWSNISPSPSHFRSGSMSSGINSSHFDLTDDTHFHNLFNQRQMHTNMSAMQQQQQQQQQQQRVNGQMGSTRGMSTSVFNLNHINRRTAEPQNQWMNNPMQQAQSMAHLNCATCASPQTNAWHAHPQHMPVNGPNGEWGGQFVSQHQLNRSNLSLNVGAGYMLPHHHRAGGMMAPPPVFMNQTGIMGGMYPYAYNTGMPIMNPGLIGMPPPTRSRATSRAVSPAMSRKSMPVRRKQRTTSYVEDELTDDEDSDQDDRRSIISNRSNMTNTMRARQRRMSSASQLLDGEGETNQQRQTRSKLRDARDRRGSVAKSVQSDWLSSRRPTMNHTSDASRQNEPGFVNTLKPTRIYSDLDSESSGTRALVQAKIQEKMEKSSKRSSSRDRVAEAARQKPTKVSTEVQAGGGRMITKTNGMVAGENQTRFTEATSKYESDKNESEEEQEGTESEGSGSEETESEEAEKEEENAVGVNSQLEESNTAQSQDLGEINEDDLGPPPSTPDHEWECEFCTFVNEPNVKICLICCKTPSRGAHKTPTTQSPISTSASSVLQPTIAKAEPSVSPERPTVNKEKLSNSIERTKDKSKDKIKEKSKDKVNSTSVSTTTTTTATTVIPKRKTGMTQSIISNLTNGMSKLKITSSTSESDAKKKESVEDVWAALDDNIQTTANEIIRKAEQTKKSTKTTKVSTSCGTSPPIREVKESPKMRETKIVQRNVKETGTSPPPQSISTQTYDTVPLKQPEPSVTEPMATGGGLLYSENSQLHRDVQSPLNVFSPDMPHYEPRHKEPETELYILLKEAELYKFTPEELHAALKYCGTSTHPVQWLRDNWHKLIQTVQSLSTKYGQERAENTIGTISQIEAREALRQHGGNIWQAVSECIEQRQRKYRDIMSKGNFSREDIVTALTIHQGNADLALMDLGRTQLKPFLMRIRGSPAGVENESGFNFFTSNTLNEHAIQPDIHEFLSANASECFQTPNAAGAAFIIDHSSSPSLLHETSTNEYRTDDIYRYSSPYNREPSTSIGTFHLDDPTFNYNRNMLKDLETLIGNIEQNQTKQNEPLLKTMETMLGDNLSKREGELENDPEVLRILMKSPIAKHTITNNANSKHENQMDVKNFVWQHIQEIVPNLVQQVEMELMEGEETMEEHMTRDEVMAPKVQPPEPPPINAEEFLLEEIIGPNIKEASIRELVPPEFVYASEIANFRMEFDRALDRGHEEEFEFESLDEAERRVYKMYEAPQAEQINEARADVVEFSVTEIASDRQPLEREFESRGEREEMKAESNVLQVREVSEDGPETAIIDKNKESASEIGNIKAEDVAFQTGEESIQQVVNRNQMSVQSAVVEDIRNVVQVNQINQKNFIAVEDQGAPKTGPMQSEPVRVRIESSETVTAETRETSTIDSFVSNEVPTYAPNELMQETPLEETKITTHQESTAVVQAAETQPLENSADTVKRRRNDKAQRRQKRSQLPNNDDNPDIKVTKGTRRTESKDRTTSKDRNTNRQQTNAYQNLKEEGQSQEIGNDEVQTQIKATANLEAFNTDFTPTDQPQEVSTDKSSDHTVKDRQTTKVSRIPVRLNASRLSGELRTKQPNQLTVVETKLTNNNENEVHATNNDRFILERKTTDDVLRQANGPAEEANEYNVGEYVPSMGIENEANLQILHNETEEPKYHPRGVLKEHASQSEAGKGNQAAPSSAKDEIRNGVTLPENLGVLRTNSEAQIHEVNQEHGLIVEYEASKERKIDQMDIPKIEAIPTTEASASASSQHQEQQIRIELISQAKTETIATTYTNSEAQTLQLSEGPTLHAETENMTETNTGYGALMLQLSEKLTLPVEMEPEENTSSKAQNVQLREESTVQIESTTETATSVEALNHQLHEESPLPSGTETNTETNTSSEGPYRKFDENASLSIETETATETNAISGVEKAEVSSKFANHKILQKEAKDTDKPMNLENFETISGPSTGLIAQGNSSSRHENLEITQDPVSSDQRIQPETSTEGRTDGTIIDLKSEEPTKVDLRSDEKLVVQETNEDVTQTVMEVLSAQSTLEVVIQGDREVPSGLVETTQQEELATQKTTESVAVVEVPASQLTAEVTTQNDTEIYSRSIETPHQEGLTTQEITELQTVVEVPLVHPTSETGAQNGTAVPILESLTYEEFQDAAELSADEEFTSNAQNISKLENGADDATSDEELYSIESEFSSHEHTRSVTTENDHRNEDEEEIPLQQSTSDTAINTNRSKKSRPPAAVEFVLSPDASKQNLSELVEDTQRLIKQMRDEINIEDFESSEEDYTDEYTDEDDYDDDDEDGEDKDWDEDDTEYDEDLLSEDDIDEQDYFDEQDEEGLSDGDNATKADEALADGPTSETESANEHQTATVTIDGQVDEQENTPRVEETDTKLSITSSLAHNEIILSTVPSSSNASDSRHEVATALHTNHASKVELISITNANNPTTYANLIENAATEIESENQTPDVAAEAVLPKEKNTQISENGNSIVETVTEEIRVENDEKLEASQRSSDTSVLATEEPIKNDESTKTVTESNTTSATSKSHEHKTPVSSKTGAISKIPQIRLDPNEASTSKAARSASNNIRTEKLITQKNSNTTTSNDKSKIVQTKPKESKIPKQTPKKVPLRSKSFSGPPGPIGISSVKTIQQQFLSRQKQLTTRLEPPKNPPTVVRKKSITEAITKFTPSTSSSSAAGASASSSSTTGAAIASIFRTQPRIPKKKYHETCFSDDDFASTTSEEEPEPLEIRQRKQSVPVFRAYPSIQEPEPEPTEVLVQKFVEEKLVATVAEAHIAATLVNMKFQQDVSIWAAKECSDLDQAISMLQQECELCMGTYPMNQIVSMLKCTHKCCKQCAKTYFTVQITDRSINDCTCPYCKLPELHGHNEHEDENLEYFSNLDIFLKSILDMEVHELFQRKLRDRTLLQDPNFKWCIQCSSGFFARPKQKRLICPDCGSVTCAQCRKTWEKQHEGISCEQFKEWKEANDPEVQAQGVQEHLAHNGIDCPKCHFRYSLARGGCMHFTCTQCKYEFCYGCGKPFMMGAKCTISSYCAKLGLHAHHPRNCLFYLRDKLPIQLQMLLKQNNVPYDEEPMELPELAMEEPSTSASKVARCPIPLQKETPTGLVDTVCNGDVPDRHAGLCRTHYVEYLTAKVAKARIDPLPIFDLTDCVQELRRRDIRLPERGPWDTDEIYKGMCAEIIKKNIPLETI